MGDINSKNCFETLQESNLMQTHSQGSSKSNIVVMNPEIHLHRNNIDGDTFTSMNNDTRIKKLEAELKIKQIEIEREREKRQVEERERYADNIKAKRLLSEKENMIQEQNDLLGWHADIINEQRAYLGEVYAHGPCKKRIRTENGTADGVQQTIKEREKKNFQHPTNRSFTGNYPNPKKNAHNYRGQRHRSKTEYNSKKDPMELWEWNGTKWVMVAEQTSVVPEDKAEDALRKDALLGRNVRENGPTNVATTTSQMYEKATGLASQNVRVHCSDDTTDRNKDTDSSNHRRATTEITFPADISISFDEREMSRFFAHDQTLFSMPKRTWQP